MQGFVKDLLDVADNLERAAGAVLPETVEGKDKDGKPLTAEQAVAALRSLLEGVQMTEKIMLQVKHDRRQQTAFGRNLGSRNRLRAAEVTD